MINITDKTNHHLMVRALMGLRPGSRWALTADEEGNAAIDWIEVDIEPSEDEILAEIARLKDEDERTDYRRLRAAAYPSFADQFDRLYHEGYDGWRAEIEAVKARYPKPQP